MERSRLDQHLVSLGLCSSRSQASDLIKRGMVCVNGEKAKKNSQLVSDLERIEILQEKVYVSRAALKLLEAIEQFNLNFKDKVVLDIGSSTGGFTQVCLDHGAKKIYAIDVGTDQLHLSLRKEDRIILMEQTNIKDVTKLDDLIDVVVCDISFISLKKFLNQLIVLLNLNAELVLLFKPQFEVGKSNVGKNGIVSSVDGLNALEDFISWIKNEKKYSLLSRINSPILGKTGNTEFLLYMRCL
jgi:23S rRNA (cytidine1920-2'-O)/16S rRNA (cytidine1409-2'-O)-methyltransferase